jgi:hypothetical protein
VFIAWYNLLYSFRRDDSTKILRRKGWNKNAWQDKISSLSPGFQIVAISSQTKSSLVTRTALAFGRDMPSDVATAQPHAGKPRLDLQPVLSSLRCLQQPTPRLDLLSQSRYASPAFSAARQQASTHSPAALLPLRLMGAVRADDGDLDPDTHGRVPRPGCSRHWADPALAAGSIRHPLLHIGMPVKHLLNRQPPAGRGNPSAAAS